MKTVKARFAIVLLFALLTSINLSAQLVIPEFSNDKYHLKIANISFEVTPAIGARFSSLKIEDTEMLYLESGDGLWGSSFWPSPQNVWLWPPPSALDAEPYTGGIVENKIWLTSNTDRETNLSFSKTIYGDLADTSINIEYVMINQKDEPQRYAPWEVTRVKPNGTTFFPAGDSEVAGDMAESTIVINNYVWYDNSSSLGMKFFSDSKGWLAHVDVKRNLFIKIFDDISVENTAPEQGEVEVYSGGNYVELENQGIYQPIAANDSTTWKVKWLLRKLPDHVEVAFGSQSLIDYTHSIVKETTSNFVLKKNLSDASLYPNPATTVIHLSKQTYIGQSYVISNTNGQIVMQGNLSTPSIKISDLTKGMYILKTASNERQYIRHFVKL